MFNILRCIGLILWGFLGFALSPILVFREPRDKVTHFYVGAVLQTAGIFLGIGGESGVAIAVAAIVKEEVVDGMIRKVKKDYGDVYWTIRGVIWATLFYLFALIHIIRALGG